MTAASVALLIAAKNSNLDPASVFDGEIVFAATTAFLMGIATVGAILTYDSAAEVGRTMKVAVLAFFAVTLMAWQIEHLSVLHPLMERLNLSVELVSSLGASMTLLGIFCIAFFFLVLGQQAAREDAGKDS